MKYLLSAAYLFVFALTGCKKEDDDTTEKMPAPSQSGRHILAFKINGAVHVYEGKQGSYGDYAAYFVNTINSDSSYSLGILADAEKYWDEIELNLDYSSKLELGKKYNLLPKGKYSDSKYMNSTGTYRTPDSSSSYIIFTRVDNAVIAGRFEFHGVNKNGGTVHLSEGMFDLTKNN